MTDKQLAETIQRYEASPEFKEQAALESNINAWVASFPLALQGCTSEKERQELLSMFKELTGKEYVG